MSALTDLFTAFANKIRSKTGGSATYTPPQMVNAIDDVYDAGVAAGTPTLTGNATASDVMSGKTFYNNSTTKQTGSYVPPTITSITPSNSSPASMTANNNYKPSANGYAISSYNSVTPSNSSPASLSSGSIYKPSAAGYAISSYSSVTPSSSGAYFASGMAKMSSSGYAYSSKPTPTLSETTLWTNSSPTSDQASSTATLSQSIENFDYIALEYKAHKSQTTTMRAIYSVADVKKCTGTSKALRMVIGTNDTDTSGSGSFTRVISYGSNTSITIGDAWRYGSTTTSKTNAMAILVYIKGLKLTTT